MSKYGMPSDARKRKEEMTSEPREASEETLTNAMKLLELRLKRG